MIEHVVAVVTLLALGYALGRSAHRLRSARSSGDEVTMLAEVLGDATYRAALLHSPNALAISGRDGRWFDVNPAAERLFGRSRDELLERESWRRMTHPDHLDLDVRFAAKLWAGEIDSYVIDKDYLDRDGDPIPVRLSVIALRSLQGTRTLCVITPRATPGVCRIVETRSPALA